MVFIVWAIFQDRKPVFFEIESVKLNSLLFSHSVNLNYRFFGDFNTPYYYLLGLALNLVSDIWVRFNPKPPSPAVSFAQCSRRLKSTAAYIKSSGTQVIGTLFTATRCLWIPLEIFKSFRQQGKQTESDAFTYFYR